jgi:Flp pilus assembly pilin Flp
MPMKSNGHVNQNGQGLVEYSLIILLVAVVITAVILLLGPEIGVTFSKVNSSLTDGSTLAPQATPPGSSRLAILADLNQRILDYYKLHGKWPRSWGDYAFTDIGLNPDDWAGPLDGIFWGPHGSDIGLANKAGDNLQVYVNDLNGNTLHLFDTWNIWCVPSSSKCYYHTIAPGNEVDISTLVVVKK